MLEFEKTPSYTVHTWPGVMVVDLYSNNTSSDFLNVTIFSENSWGNVFIQRRGFPTQTKKELSAAGFSWRRIQLNTAIHGLMFGLRGNQGGVLKYDTKPRFMH